MKHRLFFTLATAALLISVNSCTTDFNTNAPYKNIAVVNAVFTQEIVSEFQDQISYKPSKIISTNQDIKITKVFQGDGNYYEYAKVWDSVYYPEGVLDVKIENKDKYGTANLPLRYMEIDNKESGDFTFPKQAIYRLDSIDYVKVRNPISGANSETQLKLSVYNNSRKEEAFAYTSLIPEFAIGVNSATASLTSIYINFDISAPNLYTSVLIGSLSNTGRVKAQFIYEYSEIPKSGGQEETKRVVWDLGYMTADGNESVKFSISNKTFYEMLESSIQKNENVKRTSKNICYLKVEAMSIDVNNYIVANESDNSNLNGTKIFTNVKNGIGIFGSKTIKTQQFRLDQRTVTEITKLFSKIDHSFDN